MVQYHHSPFLFLSGMDYKQTLDYLYTRLPMFSRIGAAAYKADLYNTIRLCDELDNPQQKFKSIHVAGTNGKGSVSHMLTAILQTAGYKTGLYTSPHLKDFRERIKVNGEMISQEFVVSFTEKTIPIIKEIEPSFFELTVAMAFDYFAQQKVDIAIIETGLGGRLDSTNVIIPELSIITNIGWDHMNLLGDTLEKIAIEKAGIIKKDIPVIIGETQSETKTLFEKIAAERHSTIYFADEKRNAGKPAWENNELIITVSGEQHSQKQTYHLDLIGIYQSKNLLTVLEACTLLQQMNWKINDENILDGLKEVKKLTGLHGRWEVIHKSPLVVVDVAHNVNGIEQLLDQVKHTEHQQLHIILGMVKDKEVEKVLEKLPANTIYYFTNATIPRALPAEELARKASDFGLKGESFTNVNAALYSASIDAGNNDLIIVCGSVFIAGEVSLNSVKEIWGKGEASILEYDFWELIRFFD